MRLLLNLILRLYLEVVVTPKVVKGVHENN